MTVKKCVCVKCGSIFWEPLYMVCRICGGRLKPRLNNRRRKDARSQSQTR